LKTLFFGTSAFAVPSLRVVAARTRLAGVITQPDRPAGRGLRLTPSPVKSAACELGVEVHEPIRMREFADRIAAEKYDLFVLASYGRILPQALLDVPKLGALNVHPSLLPSYRGATPIQNALAAGESETGVTIMLMDAGLDTGDVVLARSIPIDPSETYGELHDRLAIVGADLLSDALELAACGVLPRRPQSGEASITHPLTKSDLMLDLELPVRRIVDKVRSLSPQPAARAILDGEIVKLLRAHESAEGRLVIDELIAPNRGKMSGEEYRRMRACAERADRVEG
jgi:methionyl-tRNA formyltransferase